MWAQIRLSQESSIHALCPQAFFKDGWSLDVCSNRATAVGEFASSDVVCTKTLYNYVDQGLLGIYNYDLPEKLKRNTKLHRIRKNKKKLGRSIEERPKEINKRNEFGHWECDLVLGHKSKDDEVLLTLSERMSREFLILRIPDKTSVSVMQAFKELQRQYSEHWNDIFKTIISSNCLEDFLPVLTVLFAQRLESCHYTACYFIWNTHN